MDVSWARERLRPLAQLPPPPRLSLPPLLSLVISLKLVPCPPFPFNFSLPSPPLSLQPQHPPLLSVLPL